MTEKPTYIKDAMNVVVRMRATPNATAVLSSTAGMDGDLMIRRKKANAIMSTAAIVNAVARLSMGVIVEPQRAV
jgi:hypothetical protein